MKTIRQSVTFKASPHDVYEALMDSRKHGRFTGSLARISRKMGGAIMAYDGYVNGENVRLVQDRLIEQKWRGNDWPESHFSTAKFALKPVTGGKTRLTFIQAGVPDDQYEPTKIGWKEHYWDKMKESFGW